MRISDGTATAKQAGAHPLAMRDWGDERGNLNDAEFNAYLAREYARLELLREAQRALNAATEEERALEPLIALAAIRHADNARAALALAETRGEKKALQLVREALGGDAQRRGVSSDQIRDAAGRAAKKLLGGRPPAEWPLFTFKPQERYTTLQNAREILR